MKLWEIIKAHFVAHRSRGKGSFFWRIAVENLAVTLFFLLLLSAVSWTTGIDIPTRTDLDNETLGGLFVIIVVMAPIIETLLLQVLPVMIARKCGLTFWWQVALSATIFALLHFQLGVATGICAGVVGGFYLGFSYVTWREKTGSGFWMTAGLHAVRNFFAWIMIAATTLGNDTQDTVSGDNFRLEVQLVTANNDLLVSVLKIHVANDAFKSKEVQLSCFCEDADGTVTLSDPRAGIMQDGEVVLSAWRIVANQSDNSAYVQMLIQVKATNNVGASDAGDESGVRTFPKWVRLDHYLIITAHDGVYPLNKPVGIGVLDGKPVTLNVGKLPGNIPSPVVRMPTNTAPKPKITAH
jgi:hypothetical protein